jgi:hypothetical protein
MGYLWLVSRRYFNGRGKPLAAFTRFEYAKAYATKQAVEYCLRVPGGSVEECKYAIMVRRPLEQHGVVWKIEKIEKGS